MCSEKKKKGKEMKEYGQIVSQEVVREGIEAKEPIMLKLLQMTSICRLLG